MVSPHRDDAAFSLGLGIEHWLQQGHRVEVLNCFTQSEYAPYSDVGSLHANDKRSFVTATRRREDVAWNKLLGGKVRITDLDLLDAPLRLSCAADEVLSAEVRPGDRALARVAGALRKLAGKGAGGELGLAIPLAVGGHIDHRVTREAAREALLGIDLPIAFYEDLPYTARPGATASVEQLAQTTGFGLQVSFPQPRAVDIAAAIARKNRLAECYDSQIDNEVARQIAGFLDSYGGRERVWANDAWRASSLSHSTEGAGA